MSSSGRKVLVWDAPTRLFHWLTVALVVTAYVTWRLNWMDWHAYVGDALLALLLFRLLLGFFGSDTTRFSSFLAPPVRLYDTCRKCFAASPIVWPVIIRPAAGWCCSSSPCFSGKR